MTDDKKRSGLKKTATRTVCSLVAIVAGTKFDVGPIDDVLFWGGIGYVALQGKNAIDYIRAHVSQYRR